MSYMSQDDSISSFSQGRLDLCPGTPAGPMEKQLQLIAQHVPERLRVAISAGELLIVGKALIFAAYTAT